MSIKIALAGNPNCGKTTLFNELTGSSQYVGNWPGVTVEKKEGKVKGFRDTEVIDLPGIYSLSPYTLEEVVSRNYLLEEKPEVILNIVDATNIERNLYLSTQLLEVGIPVVIALNMMDLLEKSKDKIHINKLSQMLGCRVVEMAAIRGTGAAEAIGCCVELAKTSEYKPLRGIYDRFLENVLMSMEEKIKGVVSIENTRYFAIKLFERDKKIQEKIVLNQHTQDEIEDLIKACEEKFDDDSESIIINERYAYISKLVKDCVVKDKKSLMTTSDKIDRIVTNRFLALPIFAVVMWAVYYISITSLGTVVTDWTNDTLFGGYITDWARAGLESIDAVGWLQGLILDGIIGGVGAVLGFVPQLMILFFFLTVLEDCGYMVRVAFIMDRIFRKFGFSGKAFIPILVSSGCGVPGIMASRTIEAEKDRKMTIIVTTFIPCGAKLPIIALIGGALYPEQSWIAPSMYFLGIFMIVLSGIFLKKTKLFAGEPAPFVIELPRYHIPGFKGVVKHVWERGKAFVIKAGTVIFVACGMLWFLQAFNWKLELVDASDSMLAAMGYVIAPIFRPLGFGTWEATVATLSGFAAKENLVGTFGVIFGLAGANEGNPAFLGQIATMFTAVSAFSFMVFNMLCAPCVAAIGTIRQEMGSWKWTFIAVGYQTLLAYVMSFIIYQLGNVLVMGEPVGYGAVLAVIMVVGILLRLLIPYKQDLAKIEKRKKGLYV
jgi:ferrous iron transport protein B